MEGNYQPGFYTTEREEHPPQQQQQQQHAGHYPLELPIPYHTTPQQQSEYVVDQPFTSFPVVFQGAQMFQDSGPVLSNSNILHHAHQHPPATFGGHGVKSVSHALPITTSETAAERNTLPISTPQLPVVRHTLPVTTREPESSTPATSTFEPGSERNHQTIRTCQSVVKSLIDGTEQESTVNNDASQLLGSKLTTTCNSQQLQDDNQREQKSSSSQEGSPPVSSNSPKEPPLLAALNLKKTSSIPDLPPSLSFSLISEDKVDGVVAKETIEKGAEFGPVTGALLNEDLGWSKDTTWEICISDRVFFYIDGCKNWMSHLRCAQSEEEQNMEAFQYYGKIYFRSTKVIEPGSELKVFYSEEYGEHVGIKTRLKDLKFNQDSQNFKCSLCERQLSSAKLIQRHVRYDHFNDTIPNKIAPVQTKTKKRLVGSTSSKSLVKKKAKVIKTRKKRVNHGESDFKCVTCDKVFPSCGRLKAHEIFHEYNQDHTCPICGKRQKNAQMWAKHMMTHKPVEEARPHKCNECNGRYKSEIALRKHECQIHGYPCRYCSERFSKKKDCQKHELTHLSFISTHSATTTSITESEPDKPKDMLGKYATHYVRKRPFKCHFCPKTYLKRQDVNSHEREIHFGDLAYHCNHCQKTFGSEALLLDHLPNHEQNHLYHCKLCPKSFRSESAFKNHQGEHTGLKPCKCEICGKGFRTRKLVCAHKRRIHQDRPPRFFCSVCNKGFLDRGNLLKHERRHKGIRPFVCLECGKGFTANNSLRTHVQCVHKKERPFSCEICSKTFLLNDHLTQHMIKHKLKRLKNDGNLGNSILE